MNIVRWSMLLFCLLLLNGCNKQAPVPKPLGYNRIDIPVYNYKEYQFDKFKLEYSDLALVSVSTIKRNDAEVWFDISYPSYNAVLHCTYLPFEKENLAKVLEDNHRLVYSHVSMADGIDQQQYTNNENKVSGIIYQIRGNVATPIQFYVTDSDTNFLRGSLYYESGKNIRTNLDSVAPVTEMVQKDIEHLMETISWYVSKK